MTPVSPSNPFMTSTNPFEADMENEGPSAQGVASEVDVENFSTLVATYEYS
jgi:hypothetical protein